MARLALMTFGITREPLGSPVVQGFLDALADAYREAENSEGFIARASGRDYGRCPFGQTFGLFGEFAAPRFYQRDKFGDNSIGQTLSLWTEISAAHGFAYGGLHKHALAQRLKWFLKPEWPTYVMWWVTNGHVPNWQEASLRLEYIHDHGPTPHAFNFGTAFDVNGCPNPRNRAEGYW
jgi:hypothetical protein